jgi:type I restriction enzyme, S subunit
MSSEWQTVPIGDIVEDVYDGPHATPAKTNSGPVFLGIWNLVDGRVDLSTTEHLSEDDFPRWTRRVLPRAGDIVFSYETKLGCAAMIPEGLRCCLGRRMALIRPIPEKVDGRFLLYSFLGPQFQEEIRARTVPGSTVERIALMEFPRYPVRLPRTLPEQRAIAGVLGALDDKIEVNRKTARVLEGIARAVFTSWFVDFDPVRRRAASHPGSAAPLPADLAALFPTRLVDSPIGEVPEGWRVARVDEVCAFEYGKAMKAEDRKVGTVPVYGSNGQIGTHDTALVRGPGVVVGRKGNPGTVIWVESDFFPIDTTFYVAPAASIGDGAAYFLYWSLERLDLPRLSADSAVPGLNRNMAYGEQLVIPDAKMIATFDALMSPLRRRCANAARQSATLAALRDALLPKLISGELRVADAEKIVGRATHG